MFSGQTLIYLPSINSREQITHFNHQLGGYSRKKASISALLSLQRLLKVSLTGFNSTVLPTSNTSPGLVPNRHYNSIHTAPDTLSERNQKFTGLILIETDMDFNVNTCKLTSTGKPRFLKTYEASTWWNTNSSFDNQDTGERHIRFHKEKRL